MSKPCVFLDRDGTINEQMGYVNHVDRFVMLPRAAEAIARLNEAGILAVVVSNQAGVARGYFPYELVAEVHEKMHAALGEAGAHLDGVYFCPHHRQGKVAPYAVDCDCRKPRPGLVEQALAELDVDMSRSYMVGDRFGDVALGRRLGLRAVMVRTGYGKGELAHLDGDRPDFVADDLWHAVSWILEDLNRNPEDEEAPC